jgi:hypothetical protein
MPIELTMTPTEKRFAAYGLAQAAIISKLLDLLIERRIISNGDVKELFQEAALTFMKPTATEVECLAAESILSSLTSRQY